MGPTLHHLATFEDDNFITISNSAETMGNYNTGTTASSQITIDNLFGALTQTTEAAELHTPDGLPEHLQGENNREVIDKLFTENKSFRDDMAKRGTVPKTAAEFVFEPDESVADLFPSHAEDPVAVGHRPGLRLGLRPVSAP